MTTFVGIYLYALGIGIVALVIRQHRNGTHELVSVRNVALVGFLTFQLTSAAGTLFSGGYEGYRLDTPGLTAVKFASMATLFICVALWSYDRRWWTVRLAERMQTPRPVPNELSLLSMSVIVTSLAVALRFGIRVPLIGVLAHYVGIGLASVAVGLVGWVWGRRLVNPIHVVFSVMVVLVNCAIAMSGTYGRRDLVAVVAALLWGMYYSSWRHMSLGPAIRRLAVIGIGPVIVVALFTSVRDSQRADRTAMEYVQAIATGGKVGEGLMLLANGQGCGRVSMFLVDSYPEDFAYRHMHTLTYFLVFPVPRALWEGKPDALSQRIARQARLRGVRRDVVTIGPGIVGHAAAEGGWYAVVVYGLIAGIFLRFFDQVLLTNSHMPLIVLPIGAALGQVLGLARGETAPFAFTYVTSVLGSMLVLAVVGRFFHGTDPGWIAPDEFDEAYEDEEDAIDDELDDRLPEPAVEPL